MTPRPLLIGLSALALGACAPGSRNVACRALGSPSTGGGAPAATAPVASNFTGTVFTIVMENHSASDILGSDEAPYINSLAQQFAVAGSYSDPQIHPSEPNYLWMAAGENFGVTNDNGPVDNHVACTAHIADQLERAGLTWKSYQETMRTPCKLVADYPYDPKHNPFVYFEDVNGWNGTGFAPSPRCDQHVVDYSQLATDITSGTLPRYVFITPNLLDDMHDGSVKDGDAWLSREIPKILDTPQWKNGGVLFLTWDEGSLSIRNDPAMIVISPLAKKGYVSQVPYDTSSYLKTVQAMLGVEGLPCDPAPEAVQTMDDLFTVPIQPAAATGTATTTK